MCLTSGRRDVGMQNNRRVTTCEAQTCNTRRYHSRLWTTHQKVMALNYMYRLFQYIYLEWWAHTSTFTSCGKIFALMGFDSGTFGRRLKHSKRQRAHLKRRTHRAIWTGFTNYWAYLNEFLFVCCHGIIQAIQLTEFQVWSGGGGGLEVRQKIHINYWLSITALPSDLYNTFFRNIIL